MSLDYTSFSPLTHGWTNEHDVKDSKGRKVFLMSEPPTDLEPNPKLGYMRFEDLYMLDDNNRPIIDYPGVPATLSTQAPPLLMEGLRRVTEMSIFEYVYSSLASNHMLIKSSSEMSRMVRERETPSGMRPRQGSTAFSNRIQRFLDNPENKAKGICPWFERAKGNATGEGIAENSEWSDEEADATKPTPEYLDPDQATVASLRNSFSRYPALASRPPAAMSLLRNFTPLAAEAASFSEHQLRRTDPRMPLPEPEVFSNGPIVARNIENRFGWAQAFTPMPSLDMDLNTDTYPTGFWSAAAGTSTTMVTPTDATPPEFDPLTVDWNDPSWDTGPHFRGSKPGSTP